MRRGDMGKHGFGRLSILTARERQVAALAHRGLSNKLVAKKLNVSEGTVKQHLHSIFVKLNIRSRSARIIRKLPRNSGLDVINSDWLDEPSEKSRVNQSVVNSLWASTDIGKSWAEPRFSTKGEPEEARWIEGYSFVESYLSARHQSRDVHRLRTCSSLCDGLS